MSLRPIDAIVLDGIEDLDRNGFLTTSTVFEILKTVAHSFGHSNIVEELAEVLRTRAASDEKWADRITSDARRAAASQGNLGSLLPQPRVPWVRRVASLRQRAGILRQAAETLSLAAFALGSWGPGGVDADLPVQED